MKRITGTEMRPHNLCAAFGCFMLNFLSFGWSWEVIKLITPDEHGLGHFLLPLCAKVT
jgi:hypothetical protein